jgi:hypothetical protein
MKADKWDSIGISPRDPCGFTLIELFAVIAIKKVQPQKRPPYAPGAPTLPAARNGNTLVLSWPLNYTGFGLESTTDLNGGAWTPVAANPPNNQGDHRHWFSDNAILPLAAIRRV